MSNVLSSRMSVLLGLAVLCAPGPAAVAQSDYPNRPVRVVIGFGPASSSDVSTRIMAEELSRLLGQRFIVENRVGASSNIAADMVAKADPDGYTIFNGSSANIVNKAMKVSGALDIAKDLKPIALMCIVPNILVVHPSLKATSVKELIELAKAEPDKLNYGASGLGSAPHLSAELLKVRAGVNMVGVQYTGTAQAMQDLIAGRLQVMFSPASTALPQIEAKTVRPLAWTTLKRGPALPDLPTVDESGLPGFETAIWFGLNGPPALPDAIRDKLADATARAQKLETYTKAMAVQGFAVSIAGPAEYGKLIADDTAKWSDVVAKAGIVKP